MAAGARSHSTLLTRLATYTGSETRPMRSDLDIAGATRALAVVSDMVAGAADGAPLPRASWPA